MRRFIPILLLISVFQPLSYSQEFSVNDYQRDTIIANKYYNQCKKITYIYPDSAFKYTDSLLSISVKANYTLGKFNAHNLKGILYWLKNDTEASISHYQEALSLSERLTEKRKKAMVLGNIGLLLRGAYMLDSAFFYINKTIDYTEAYEIADLHAKALLDMGNLYLDQDNYVLAAQYLTQSKEAYETLMDTSLLSIAYGTLGVLYIKVKRFDKALANINKAIQIDESTEDINNLALNYVNIGELYFQVRQQYDSALIYYRKAIPLALPHQKDNLLLTTDINIGNVFIEKMDYDSAGYYYHKAIENPLLSQYPNIEAATYVNLGTYYLRENDFKKARQFLNKGYEKSKDLGIKLYEKNALLSLSNLDSAEGNFNQALIYYKLYSLAANNLEAISVNNKIAILEFDKQLELEKFNNDFLLQQNKLKSNQITIQKWIIWISLSASLILLVLLYLLYVGKLRRKKLMNQLNERHKDLIFVNEELNVTNENLTEQKKLLKELNITKDKFFSILGHDLKSPFNSLLGMLDLLYQQWDSIEDKEKRDHIRSLFDASEKTYHLLEDLLNWGKAQQGLIKYMPETFLLRPKIIEITEYFTLQIKDKNLEVGILVPEHQELTTDYNLFARIIQNMVHNAIKYTPSGGKITIKCEENLTGQFCICVSDRGIGIPKNKLSNIFGLDCDFSRPGTNNEKSTGMGLILIREYAEIINGTLSVSSVEGKGSTFCLCLKKNNV